MEITEDFPDHGPDILIASVSTGGHLSGTAAGLKMRGAKTRTIGVDVRGSVVFGGVKSPTAVTGMGLGWVPDNLDEGVIDEAFIVETRQCFAMVRQLARRTGLLLGGSSGAAVFVAIGEALRQGKGKTVLALAPDGGEKYLDEFYNDAWLSKRGLAGESLFEELLAEARSLAPFRYPAMDRAGRVA